MLYIKNRCLCVCYAHVGEPKNINVGKKDTHRDPVCLFTREQGVIHLSPWASKISGLDTKGEQQTQVKRECSLLTFLEKLRGNTIVNIHLLTYGALVQGLGTAPEEMLNQTFNPRAGCITLIYGPYFHTSEGALPLPEKSSSSPPWLYWVYTEPLRSVCLCSS